MKNHPLTKAFVAVAAAFLLATPGLMAEEKLVADIRGDFPGEGVNLQQPDWKNGWIYFVAPLATFSHEAAMVWWQDAEKWPDGILSARNTGHSRAGIVRNRSDTIEVLPGDDEKWLVARWNSNVSGTLRVRGSFRKIQSSPEAASENQGIEFMVRHNEGENLFSGISEALNDTAEKEFDVLIPDVKEGDPVDIIVRGITRNWASETHVAAQIFLVD